MSAPIVTNVVMTAANHVDRAMGLLGYVRFEVAGLIIDGVTVRRSLTGDLILGFPKRTDRHGRDHAVVRPTDEAARRALTTAVLRAGAQRNVNS